MKMRLIIPNTSFYRSSHRRRSIKEGVLRNFAKISPKACNFIKKETLAQVFSCAFCKISKNTFSTKHVQTTGSGFISLTKYSDKLYGNIVYKM